MLSDEGKYMEIPKEKYNLLNDAVREMRTPHYNAEDFIQSQIEGVPEKYEE